MSKPESTREYMVMPMNLAQAIVNYLEQRPHREVRALIDNIVACNPRPRSVSRSSEQDPPVEEPAEVQ